MSISRLVPTLLIGLLIGAAVMAGYYQANPVTVVETEYQTVTKTEYVADNATVFVIDNYGSWAWPTTVEFSRPDVEVEEWHTVFVARVGRGEPFAVRLNKSERYRIHVTSADGEERVMAFFEPRKEQYHITIKACCH